MTYKPTESERNAIAVARVVVIGVAVAVDITEVIAVARIRRTLPPVVRRALTPQQKTTKRDLTKYLLILPGSYYLRIPHIFP